MGLILDTSLLIAEERGKFDMAGFLSQFSDEAPAIAAITAAELLHGVERAVDARKARRKAWVENLLGRLAVIPFDLSQARELARLWAELVAKGQMIGAYDLQIAATGVALGYRVATLNLAEFRRVKGLTVVDPTEFVRAKS